MIITIRRKLKTGIVYRFRPVISIAQKTPSILIRIKEYLGYGHMDSYSKVLKGERFTMCHFVVNGLDSVLRFVKDIAPYCELKKDALFIIGELARFQQKGGNKHRNLPYSKEDTAYMLDLRDRLFNLNEIRKAHISQKYSREQILAESAFVEDYRGWVLKRARASAASRRKNKENLLNVKNVQINN